MAVSTLTHPALVPHQGDAQTDVLRLLGRLHVVVTPNIEALIYQPLGKSQRTLHRDLKHLEQRGLIWYQEVSHGSAAQGRPPKRQPRAWGLTPAGRQHLDMMELEPDADALERFKVRDRRAPDIPRMSLPTDLTISWWVAAIIHESRRSALCTGVFAQVGYYVMSEQTLPALVGVRLERNPANRPAGLIPWVASGKTHEHQRWHWFALDVDHGHVPAPVIQRKAATYAKLNRLKWYQAQLNLGGHVLPVVLAPTERRLAQIREQWRAAWPTATTVSAVPTQFDHAPDGVLWTPYRRLLDGEATNLIQVVKREAWHATVDA